MFVISIKVITPESLKKIKIKKILRCNSLFFWLFVVVLICFVQKKMFYLFHYRAEKRLEAARKEKLIPESQKNARKQEMNRHLRVSLVSV